MSTFQYDAKIPTSLQWQIGIQKSLPWGMVGDMSYVGNHGINRLAATQNGNGQNLNMVDIGAAYLPKKPGPDAGAERYPRGVGLHDKSAPSLPGSLQYQRAGDAVLGHVSLAAI